MKVGELFDLVEGVKARSTWEKGVKEYALELLGWMDEDSEFTPEGLLVGQKIGRSIAIRGGLLFTMQILPSGLGGQKPPVGGKLGKMSRHGPWPKPPTSFAK